MLLPVSPGRIAGGRRGLRLVIALVLLTGISPRTAGAGGLPVVPFYTRDQGPFTQGSGFPPPEGGDLTPAGSWETRLVFDISNCDNLENRPGESLRLDGETYRTTLALRYGLLPRMEVGLDIPFIAHSPGFLDGFVDTFHKWTHLGPRKTDKYRLDYSYGRDGGSIIDIRNSTSGIGDILLSIGYPLYRTEEPSHRAIAIRAGLKLPTGEERALRGSGGVDLSLRLSGTDGATLSRWNLTYYGMAGVLMMGPGDLLEDQRRRSTWFGATGIGWNAISWLALKVQVDMHGTIYRGSDTNVLNLWVLQLVTGGSIALPWESVLDFGLSENVFHETSPDETFHFALRKRF